MVLKRPVPIATADADHMAITNATCVMEPGITIMVRNKRLVLIVTDTATDIILKNALVVGVEVRMKFLEAVRIAMQQETFSFKSIALLVAAKVITNT